MDDQETLLYRSSGLKKVYFHINNGGISFEVDGRYMKSVGIYPLLRISSSHFGHKTNEMEINMTPSQMRKMGEWLISESEHADNFADDTAKDSQAYPFMEMMAFDTSTGKCDFEHQRCCGGGECHGDPMVDGGDQE